MNSRAPIALAIGAGYLLGRTHKMRWALLLGAAAASGRLNNVPGDLIQRGTKVLGSSPELTKIGDSAERLLDAGKAAASTALASRVESLSSALTERAEALGQPASEAAGKLRETGRRKGRGLPEESAEEPEEELDEEGEGPEDEAEEDEEYEDEEEEDEEEEDEEVDEEDEEPEPAQGRGSGSGSVVRKTGGRSR